LRRAGIRNNAVVTRQPSPAPLRICIAGNSVALKIRPPRQAAGDKTYTEILQAAGFVVQNVSRAGVTIDEAFATFDDDVLRFFPDLVVFNFGVIEACRRRTSRWLWLNTAASDVYLNHLCGRPFPLNARMHRLRYLALRAITKLGEAACRVAGISWHWVSPSKFLEVLTSMIDLVLKETNAGVLVIGVNPCAGRVEQAMPGSEQAARELNARMKLLCSRKPRVTFLDPFDLFAPQDLGRHVPDGVHLSVQGHRTIAAHVLSALTAGEHSRTLESA
jgi:hypothetical protein